MDLIICVYGDFSHKDLRVRLFPVDAPDAYQFQNVLTDAGYDALLFVSSDLDISGMLTFISR